MLKILFVFGIFKIILAQQQIRNGISSRFVNQPSLNYGAQNSNSNTYLLQQPYAQQSLVQPQQIAVTPSSLENMFTLFPTLSPIFFSTMTSIPLRQPIQTTYNNNEHIISNNYNTNNRNLPSSNVGTNTHINTEHTTKQIINNRPYIYDYTFAPGTLPTFCGYGVNPIPIYNTPYKKCIPNDPFCGLFYTCIMDVNERGEVLGRSAN